MDASPYALSDDTASCWRWTGSRFRRKMKPAEIAILKAFTGLLIGSVLGDEDEKARSAGEFSRAVLLGCIDRASVGSMDSVGSLLSRGSSRVRGRRSRAERRKR